MGVVQSLSVLVLRQMAAGASRALGVIGIDGAVEFLNTRFTDGSRLLTGALQAATDKAWRWTGPLGELGAVEIPASASDAPGMLVIGPVVSLADRMIQIMGGAASSQDRASRGSSG